MLHFVQQCWIQADITGEMLYSGQDFFCNNRISTTTRGLIGIGCAGFYCCSKKHLRTQGLRSILAALI